MALLTTLVLVFAGFTYATVDNYTDVVIAKVSTTASYEGTVDTQRFGDAYDEDSLFFIWINFTISNPSPKPLRMWLINLKAWVRDYEVEDGRQLERAFRDDRIRVNTESGMQTLYYFPALIRTKSYLSTLTLVDAHSNANFTTFWQIGALISLQTTANLASIYEYATTLKGLEPEEVEWYYFAQILILVHGVRRDYSGLNDAYLLQVPLIVRYINFDISS